MEIYHKETYKNHNIEIFYDENTENPLHAWDVWIGEMWVWGYSFGHHNNEGSMAEVFEEHIDDPRYRLIPLSVYDHSGVKVYTGTHQKCRWDSGALGCIIIDLESLPEWAEGENVEQLDKYAEQMVETLNRYLSGEVYGFVISDENGEELDSCWGYYEDVHEYWYPNGNGSGVLPKRRDGELLREIKSTVDGIVAKKHKNHFENVKAWVRNRVPLLYRTALSY